MITLKLAGAFIGNDLEFRRNVNVEVDESGKIADIYERRSGRGNFIAMPPLINSHIHTADYAFPETGNWLGLEELVAPPNGLKHRLLREADPDRVRMARIEVIKMSLRSGVAALADFVEGDPMAARVSSGIRHMVLGRPDSGGYVQGHVDGLGLPDIISYSRDKLRELSSRFRGMPVLVHVSETRKIHEMNDFEIAMELLRPTAIVHGTYLNRDEIRELAKQRVGAVLCPRSNLWFSVGKPDIASMLNEDVMIALGTDNAGWIKPDVWREMEAAVLLLRHQDPTFNKPAEVLKMA
ncbi:MAG: amidohydrolase family protein, partial [Nitrososphaeria archaeon]